VASVSERARVSVQGAADMAMSFFGGLAGFSSGFIRKAVGYHLLSTLALVLALLLAGAAWIAASSRRIVPAS